MAAPPTAEEIRDVNARYHDGAAAGYDAKWGIDFGPTGQSQVVSKLRKALGREPGRYARSLEIGAGTGYFSLNLVRAGVVEHATCTDISAGMVDALRANARTLGLDVEARTADAEVLPFEDERFDLVLGHAVLHHLPDLDAAFREFHRVLRPGGVVVFAGEPSHHGDRIASIPKRVAYKLSPAWRAVLRAGPARAGASDGGAENHELEHLVDVHAFTPEALSAPAKRAGFADVRVSWRGARGQLVRLGQPDAGGDGRPRRGAVRLEALRLPRLPRVAGSRPAPAGVAAAAGDLLQPHAHGDAPLSRP
jgi:ubiquinone/menaquinone biosynthesis C-methylase UbiE